MLFLQETHSSSKDKIKQKDEFKGDLFLLLRKTNSWGVAISYTGKRFFKFSKRKNDKNGRFLI